MKRIGYLNEEGSLVRIPSVGEIAMVDGEPYIVESVEGEDLNVLNEEESCVVNEKEIDEEVFEVIANENTGRTVDGMVCLGDTELGEAYANEADEVFINEAFTNELQGEMVYRDKKTNEPIVTGHLDPKKDTIMYWDVNGDHFTIKKSEFSKKFKAGKEEDFDMFESVKEEE